MTSGEVEVSSLILKEFLGVVVQQVGTYLLKNNHSSMRVIAKDTKLKLGQVKKALCTLVQQNMVTFEWNKKGYVDYSIVGENVLMCSRFPHFIYLAKLLYGDAGELLVEETLQHGQVQMSAILRRVVNRYNQAFKGQKSLSLSDAKEKFIQLVHTQFLQRCASSEDPESIGAVAVPNLHLQESEMYQIPPVNMAVLGQKRKLEDDGNDVPVKRQKTDFLEASVGDEGIYWRLNYERLIRHMRDQIIISAVKNKIDKKASDIVRTMLNISEVKSNINSPVTAPMSNHEIYQALPKDHKMPQQSYEQYMKIMTEDTMGFILKTGESGGGMYAIDLKKAVKVICQSHVESVVQERLGSKNCRIFRLLLMKKHLEQKQIEEFAMIPAKEAKEMLYKLFSEHFITLTEVPRTPDHAPSRTFYLFSVNLKQVVRNLLLRAHKALANLKLRREHETSQNKRLLDKQQRVDAIIATLEQGGADESQKAEIQDTITLPERTQLNKVKHMTNKLEQSELQLDETILILQLFIRYTSESS